MGLTLAVLIFLPILAKINRMLNDELGLYWAIADENGQKTKFLHDLFKPSDVATLMNADRKTTSLTIFSSLIM